MKVVFTPGSPRDVGDSREKILMSHTASVVKFVASRTPQWCPISTSIALRVVRMLVAADDHLNLFSVSREIAQAANKGDRWSHVHFTP